ncbi:MAG: hypothetical protein OXU79_20175 [Gemmatimonadota bacterium]|nr:hypothetical protein [Gemmatimonadota bacterium]
MAPDSISESAETPPKSDRPVALTAVNTALGLALSAIFLTAALSGADDLSGAGVPAPTATATSSAGADLADPVPEGDRTMPLLVDAHPTQPNLSTLISVLHPMLQSAGQTEWSTDRLRGVTGHAFAFEMRKGGGEVWHDANLDWWLWFYLYPQIAQFRVFNTTKADLDVDLPALKAEARDAVRASLQKGIPALAWQAMSPEQKASGFGAGSWGMLAGYDDTDETYTVRHKWRTREGSDFSVRYDAIGHARMFSVMAYDGPSEIDERTTHRAALRNAVAFANGTRYDPSEAAYDVDARGFAAYELWHEALESEDVSPFHSHFHARILRASRQGAAGYLRELVDVFPEAGGELNAAAARYERELEALEALYEICHTAKHEDNFPANARARARALIAEALEADRKAVAHIEAALSILDTSE